jgi:hypothetical protein
MKRRKAYGRLLRRWRVGGLVKTPGKTATIS